MGAEDRSGRGGIRSLVELIDEHCEAFEYDLKHYCHTRLRDVFTGGVSWRELWVYFLGFPHDSLTKTALRAKAEMPEPWTSTEVLLARVGNELGYQNYLLKVAHGFEGKHEPPTPLLPPGTATVTDLPTERRARQQRAYLERLRAHQGSPT